jgi:hypothetical protein
LTAGFLVACGSLLTFTPEEAAVRDITERGSSRLGVDPTTVRVLQVQPWQESTAVLLFYTVNLEVEEEDDCLRLTTVQRVGLDWRTQRVATACMEADTWALRPLEVVTDSNHVMGLVTAEGAVQVEVEWDDGETQQVEIINGSFLALTEGSRKACRVQVLDADGNVLAREKTGDC